MKKESCFILYSPWESFSSEGIGCTKKLLIDHELECHGDERLWQIGMDAYQVIVDKSGTEPSDCDLCEGLSKLNNFVMSFENSIDGGVQAGDVVVTINGEPIEKNKFTSEYRSASVCERLDILSDIFVQMDDESLSELFNNGYPFALCCLFCLDDVVTSELLDGRGMDNALISVSKYSNLSKQEDKLKAAIEASKSKGAKNAADKRHEETNSYKKEAIQMWEDGNFNSIEEAARYISRQIPMKHRTITNWISKYLRSLHADCTPSKDKE